MSEIDPREFGKLEAQVEALQMEVHALREDVKKLLEMANKSKGGFWDAWRSCRPLVVRRRSLWIGYFSDENWLVVRQTMPCGNAGCVCQSEEPQPCVQRVWLWAT